MVEILLRHSGPILSYENNEIEALKFGSENPIWKLPGVVDGHMIKPDALTSDAEGNVYISDGTNNRILKINGLTGNVLNILLLEEREKRIDYLLWSDTEPNLTLIHGDRINTYQWRIQDFPEEGAPTPQGGGANIRFCQFSPKTA